jgi:hypothetical protein
MPNSETFDIEPTHNFVWKYLHQAKVSVDPFARNRRWATHTNDLNPKTNAVIREAIDKTLPKWISVEDEVPPKDGSEVILRVRRAGIEGSVVAHWMPGGHCIQDHPPIDEGWYWWNKSYFDISPNPTHWMRLPEPPAIRSLKQSNSGMEVGK